MVAGYYQGKYSNTFEKSVIPYALVMEDKINPKDFLPAARSMAFRKKVWEEIGGFDEKLSHNEDFAFANKIKDKGFKIQFQKNAIVYWLPRKNITQAFKMFFRFALGDAQANIFRPKVTYIFLRYIFAAYLLILIPIMKSLYFNLFIISLFLAYVLWSISKNFKYVKKTVVIIYLPLLQFTSDIAVLTATSLGVIQKINLNNFLSLVRQNSGVFLIIFGYILTTLLLINWGIPNTNHPFSYAMDEWHFLQSLRAFITQGTGLVSGSANIPFYHIVSSIIFLVPFYLFSIVNPLAIKSSIDNLPMQQVLFEVLRLHTLLYGVLSVWVIYDLLRKYVKRFSIILTTIFTLTPLFLLLTNYYKYDITLLFWIIVTLYLLFKYYKSQNVHHFIFAGIATGLALSTKFTAIPLFVSYILSFFIFTQKRNYKYLIISIFVILIVFLLVGIPDIVFGKGNYYELLSSTLVQGPKLSNVFNLGYPVWSYLLFRQFPSIFGYFIIPIYFLSMIFFAAYLLIKFLTGKIREYKIELFLFMASLLFLIVTISFNLDGGGNRALVLLPFMVILSGIFFKTVYNFKVFENYKNIIYAILFLGIILQTIQSFSWISVKIFPDPREVSSKWIIKNIPPGSEIGVENIPIYQMLPDFVVKDYYFKQYNKTYETVYKYQIISKDSTLPKYVIVTNDFDNANYVKSSPKKDLIRKLNENGYKKIIVFSPQLKYYNLFANRLYFVVTNIIQMPISISIYEK